MFATTMTIVILLLLEVCLRIFGLGCREFFSRWFNTLDLAVSVISLALELVVFAAFEAAANADYGSGSDVSGGDAAAAGNFAALRVLRPAARILRVCRVSTRAVRQKDKLKTEYYTMVSFGMTR